MLKLNMFKSATRMKLSDLVLFDVDMQYKTLSIQQPHMRFISALELYVGL